jgi:hypothetical protein
MSVLGTFEEIFYDVMTISFYCSASTNKLIIASHKST